MEETPQPVITESEVVDMPNAPVTKNSQPEVIEGDISEPVESPIADPTPIVDPVAIPTEEPIPDMFTARSSETGDKVYVIKAGKRYWVKNPETLAQLGFYLGKEKSLPFSELLGFSEGEPVDMTIPGAEFPWDKPETPKSTEPTSSSAIWS